MVLSAAITACLMLPASCASVRSTASAPSGQTVAGRQKLLYVMNNFILAQRVDETIELARRAAKAG
jgi:hypothetical protein